MNPCASLPTYLLRLIAHTVAMAFLLGQFGCVSRPPSLDLHWQLRNEVTALVPARLETVISLEPFAVGRPSGALEGAGVGFVSCLQGFGSGSCSGEICGAVLIVILGLAITCSAVGAVVGAVQATAGDDAEKMRGSMSLVTQQLASHLNLASMVLTQTEVIDGLTVELIGEEALVWMEEPQRWQELKKRGFVNALEIGVTEIEFFGGSGRDPDLSLHMMAQARLIELATGEEKYREQFHYVEPPMKFSKWASDQGHLMKLGVEAGLEKLSRDITSRLFEQVELPISSGSGALPWSDEFGCCWLCPKSPSYDLAHKFWEGKVEVKFLSVSSTRPELVWETFPRPSQEADLRKFSGTDSSVITYDLRIWQTSKQGRGPLVYERVELPEPRHRLEESLKSGHRYFWSFRACFDVGQGRVCTPWAFSAVPSAPSCDIPSIPTENYYRFSVP